MTDHRTFILPLLILLLVTPFSQTFGADELPSVKTIVVAGTGDIRKNDSASAREAAISESLVAAVGLVIIDLMPLDLTVQNFQTLNEVMYKQTEKFIHGYRVLTEAKYENRYRVMVEARVSVIRIRDHLSNIGFLIGRKELPKILFMIAEQGINAPEPIFWWGNEAPPTTAVAEKALTDAMKKKGFGVVNYALMPVFTNENEAFQPDVNEQTALAFGNHYGADVVIFGRAFSEQTTNIMGEDTRSFKATISVRGLRVETGEEIAATFQTKTNVNTDDFVGSAEALLDAGTVAGDDLALQIILALKEKENQSASIKIAVQGTNFLSNYVKFRRAVKSIQGVKSIRASEMKSNAAVIFIDYQKTARELAEALMLKSFKNFGINISEVTDDFLNIELVSKNRPPVPVHIVPQPQ